MQKLSKEGIIVNKNQKGINTEDLLHLGNREASIIAKETTKDNMLISRGMILEGLHHKEHHSLPCM